MSFYTYWGKLDNELLVAVLPNGTVEHDDPVYLFLNKKFSTYRAKDVSITEDGEDLFVFNDGYYTFKAVSKKAHRELDLTVKGGSSKVSKVLLTRHYDQPITAIPSSNSPKIWSGAFNFHGWAKNESFIAIAPKGLGNGNPIVSLWQWTKDAKGVPNSVSTSVSQQKVDAATPTAFSFEQNGYYIVICKVNEKTKGLDVTIKAPTNPDAVQNEIPLSKEITLAAEHKFAPPRAPQEKITLECSLPRSIPSLPRITGALPFPADLVETLKYSAAYLDQAGYMANYAVKQFDQLDRSYHQLEKKSESRLIRLTSLEGEIGEHKKVNAALKAENVETKKQLEQNRRAAAVQDDKLSKTLAALAASESLIKSLEKYIADDKIEDFKRHKAHQEHVIADQKAIQSLQNDLCESQEAARNLQESLDASRNALAASRASEQALSKELAAAKADIAGLRTQVDQEKKFSAEIKHQLDNLTWTHGTTEKQLNESKAEVSRLGTKVIQQKVKLDSADKVIQEGKDLLDAAYSAHKATKAELEETERERNETVGKLEFSLREAREHDQKHEHGVAQLVPHSADTQKSGGIKVTTNPVTSTC